MSAVILLIIVIAWVAVLVPYLLRRHDQVTEARSVDSFEKTMRVLSRRSETVEASREIVVPKRHSGSTSVTVTVNGTTPLAQAPAATRDALLRTRDPASIPDPRPVAEQVRKALRTRHDFADEGPATPEWLDPSAARAHQLARRRRTMVAVTALPVVLLGVALLVTPWAWVGQVLADVLLVGFVVHIRQETARQRARRRRQVELARRARAREEGVGEPSYARATEPPAHLSHAAAERQVVIEKQPDGSWVPLPVPVPTYVTAPRAPERPAPAPEHPAAEQVEPERRKAVGE